MYSYSLTPSSDRHYLLSNNLIIDDNLFVDISTSVLEGRVLLTGLVDNQEIRIEAVRKVWEVEGVNEVVNEILNMQLNFRVA